MGNVPANLDQVAQLLVIDRMNIQDAAYGLVVDTLAKGSQQLDQVHFVRVAEVIQDHLIALAPFLDKS